MSTRRRPDDAEVLLEAATTAVRERDASGRIQPSPAWADLTPEQLVSLLTQERRLAQLTPEQLASLLAPEQLVDALRSLPADVRAQLRRQLDEPSAE